MSKKWTKKQAEQNLKKNKTNLGLLSFGKWKEIVKKVKKFHEQKR